MKLKWTRLEDSWLCTATDGFEGWAGPSNSPRNRLGFTMNYSYPIGHDGCCYGGGGDFYSLETAKKALGHCARQ